MNKILQGIIIIILAIAVSFFHPLNAKEKDTYVFTPVDNIVKLKDVKFIGTYVEWNCLECIEDIINEFHKYGDGAARLAYRQYLKVGIVIPVQPGYYDVIFIKEYKGYWIFKIK